MVNPNALFLNGVQINPVVPEVMAEASAFTHNAAHWGKTVIVTSDTGVTITLGVNVDEPVGTRTTYIQGGAGILYFQSSGVTQTPWGSGADSTGVSAEAHVTKLADNAYHVSGQVTAD